MVQRYFRHADKNLRKGIPLRVFLFSESSHEKGWFHLTPPPSQETFFSPYK